MPDAIHFTNGTADFAFEGDRNNIWHRHGQQKDATWTAETWRIKANMNYTAIKIPAYVPAHDAFSGGKHPGHFDSVPNAHFVARNDTGALLSDKSVSDVYQPHQIADLQDTLQQYCDVDDRFTFSTMGALDQGARVFMCARFKEPQTVAGDAFTAFLLATTSFDSSGASLYSASMTRSVCANTVAAALGSAAGTIRVRHNTKFDKARASKELAAILQSVTRFKVVGDAMAQTHIAAEAVAAYFRSVLDIPLNVTITEKDGRLVCDDLSTKKLNQYDALRNAYSATLQEGTEKLTAWSAFNAVTRYVDHARAARGGDGNKDLARFMSAQFGSGAALKTKAYDLLLPLIKDKIAA